MNKLFTCIFLLFLLTMSKHSSVMSAETLLDDEMSRLIYMTDKYTASIRKSNLIYQDKIVTDYLQKIMQKLFPDYDDVFQIHIFNSSEINASAAINGHIYMRLGMLAKANSEAQIAAILAHEGIHVINNHQLGTMRNRKWVDSGSDLNTYDPLALLSDYAIELEEEADNEGFSRLVAAKYDPKEAIKIFQSMANEAKNRFQADNSLYASHPKLLDRIVHFTKLSKGYSGYIGEDSYFAKMSAIKLECLRRNVTNYRFNSVLLDLKNNIQLSKSLPSSWFYIGEAYRQRAATNDENNSEKAYLKVIELKPDFAPSYRALGVLYMQKQDYQKALTNFDKYLAMSPDAPDRLYIIEYYKEIKNNGLAQ